MGEGELGHPVFTNFDQTNIQIVEKRSFLPGESR